MSEIFLIQRLDVSRLMRTADPSADQSAAYLMNLQAPSGYKLHSWRSETALYDATVIVMWVRKETLPLAALPALPPELSVPAIAEWVRKWLTKAL